MLRAFKVTKMYATLDPRAVELKVEIEVWRKQPDGSWLHSPNLGKEPLIPTAENPDDYYVTGFRKRQYKAVELG